MTNKFLAPADTRGKIAAGVMLPDLPEECRKMMARIQPRAGEKWRGVILRANTARKSANARVARCAGFYDDVKRGLAAGSAT